MKKLLLIVCLFLISCSASNFNNTMCWQPLDTPQIPFTLIAFNKCNGEVKVLELDYFEWIRRINRELILIYNPWLY